MGVCVIVERRDIAIRGAIDNAVVDCRLSLFIQWIVSGFGSAMASYLFFVEILLGECYDTFIAGIES